MASSSRDGDLELEQGDALKVLQQQDMEVFQYHQFDPPFSMEALKEPSREIKVGVRVRPQTDYEFQDGMRKVFHIEKNEFVLAHPDAETAVWCDFEYCYGETERQSAVYKDFGAPMLAYTLAGYNTALFLYGPSHSGKNYTLFGNSHSDEDATNLGILRRLARDLFHHMDLYQEEADFLVEMEMLEVRSDKVRDLLDIRVDAPFKRVYKDPDTGEPIIEDISTFPVRSYEDFEHTLERGLELSDIHTQERFVRWHTLVRLRILQTHETGDHTLFATCTLGLLKGPDRFGKKGGRGEVLREDAAVNKGIVALADVIAALADRCKLGEEAAKKRFIPYDESKLTSILRSEIGGNFVTSFLVCLPPTEYTYSETLEVIDFVRMLRQVQNLPVKNSRRSHFAEFRERVLSARKALPKSKLCKGHPLTQEEEQYAQIESLFVKTFGENMLPGGRVFQDEDIWNETPELKNVSAPDISQENRLWRASQKMAQRHGDRSTMYIPEKGGKKATFTGQWEDDQRSGMGRLEKDDMVYEGQWQNSRRHGLGTLFLKREGKLVRVYKGYWANHRRNGYGVQYYKSGEIYEGEWHDNVREGEGTHFFNNGDKYEGEWSNDVKSGWGRLIKANGDVFEGHWQFDKREGPGIFFYHSTGHKMEGEWHNDVCKFGSMVVMEESEKQARSIPENELVDPLTVLRNSKVETDRLRAAVEEERAMQAEEEALRRQYEEYGEIMEELLQQGEGAASGVQFNGSEFHEDGYDEIGSEMGSQISYVT